MRIALKSWNNLRSGARISIVRDRQSSARFDLFLASALFLFLELAFIRWFPAQVLFLTFFTNTVLLASFLGLSLGCLTARSCRNHFTFTPLLLLISLAGGAAMEHIRLALQRVLDVGASAHSPQMVFFGTDAPAGDVASFVVPMEYVVGLFFVLIASTMIGPGQILGRCFAALPNAVEAYVINISGSLIGVLGFTFCSRLLPPVGWFAIAAAAVVYFLRRDAPQKTWPIGLAVAAPLLLLVPQYSASGVIRQNFPQEFWSPYYRVNYSPSSRAITVNLIGHQNMLSRTDPHPAYALPYLLNRDAVGRPFHDILIIGAGSGNDVSRALQFGAPDVHIDAIEIDPIILKLGQREHPDHPYQDRRVTTHLNDGRNYLRFTNRKYDLVVFALVDSLVLHSSVSNIRLESYLFTYEALADVRRVLNPGGLFVMYNYFRRGWIVGRLVKTSEAVFGSAPVVISMPQRERLAPDDKIDGFTALLQGPRAEEIRRVFQTRPDYSVARDRAPEPTSPNGFDQVTAEAPAVFSETKVEVPAHIQMAVDVWPFLYLRNPMIPSLSWRGMALIGSGSLAMLLMFAGRTVRGQFTRLDAGMFLLGAGFMLLETKAVVHMALVFGSTWIVNTVVFSAVLVMILIANLWVLKHKPGGLTMPYLILLAALAANVAIPLDSLLGWPRVAQGIAAGGLVLSPVLCAGVIFARLFALSERPERSLAFNSAGAILGGLAETCSLLIGFQWILAVAAAIYIASWVCAPRARPIGWKVFGLIGGHS